MVNSNSKGKRGERELAAKLTEVFGAACRRGQQYCGIEGDDVVGLEGIHIECKRTEKLSLYAAMEQAEADTRDGEVSMLCHRRNNERWLAIVDLEDLPELARKLVAILGDSK